MLVLDSQSLANRAAREQLTARREKHQALVAENESRAKAATATDGEHATTVLEAQLGRSLHSSDFIKKIKAINPQIRFEISKNDPSRMGAYISNPGFNTLDPDPAYRGWQFICGMERGTMPEFSVRKTKEDGTFAGEVRGWRTVLARFIRAGFISLPSVDKHFRSPSRSSKNWQTLVT